MHIFQVIPQLSEGGAERFVVDLCNVLVKEYNCQVTLIVFFNFDQSNAYLNDLNKNINVIILNKKLGLDLTIITKLFKILKKTQPDVIHTHLNAFEYMFVISFFFKNRIKFFNTIHSSPKRMYNKLKNRFIPYLLYRFGNVVPIVISQDSINEFTTLFPDVNPKLIFNGRNEVSLSSKVETVIREIDSYKKSQETTVFINLARITPVKNQVMLVDAFNQLLNQNKDVILLIVGTPGDKEIFEELKKRIKSGIYLLGFKDNPTDYLYCSNAFCLTSFYEGMPISLLEAIQKGIIPICTPAGGIKDILNPSLGLLSKGFSTDEYVEALISYLSLSKEKRQEMSSNAVIAYKEKYTMKITASKYYQYYSK